MSLRIVFVKKKQKNLIQIQIKQTSTSGYTSSRQNRQQIYNQNSQEGINTCPFKIIVSTNFKQKNQKKKIMFSSQIFQAIICSHFLFTTVKQQNIFPLSCILIYSKLSHHCCTLTLIYIIMTIKLYIDFMSQPSRAVWALCNIAKVPYEIKQVRVGKFETNSQDYKIINPMGKVPSIQDTDNGFRLAESHAIMRYICTKYPEHIGDWYPSNNYLIRSKIDEYLDFHHTNTRKCAYFLFNSFFSKNMKIPSDPQFVEEHAQKDVHKVLNSISKVYLGQTKYIVGDKPTIADLSAYYQIQFLMIRGQNFQKWPKIKAWLQRMGQIQQVRDANKVFIQILKRFQPNAKI